MRRPALSVLAWRHGTGPWVATVEHGGRQISRVEGETEVLALRNLAVALGEAVIGEQARLHALTADTTCTGGNDNA